VSKPTTNHVIQTLRSLPREERQVILDALKGNWPARNDERSLELRQFLCQELDKYRTRS
jgi:hypothetical protein